MVTKLKSKNKIISRKEVKDKVAFIDTPYVEACKDLYFRYYAEKPTIAYEMNYENKDGKYYNIKEYPQTIIRAGFEQGMYDIAIFYNRAEDFAKKLKVEKSDSVRKKYEQAIEAIKTKLVPAYLSRTYAKTVLDEISEDYQVVNDEWGGKFDNYAPKFVFRKYAEIPLAEMDGAVGEFSKLLDLPEETVRMLSLFSLCETTLMDGLFNRKLMYQNLFRYSKEQVNSDNPLKPEYILEISKFFGDYDVVSNYDMEDNENEYFAKYFPDGIIEEYAKAETAEARREIVEKHTEVTNVLLNSLKHSNKAIPLYGKYKKDNLRFLLTLDELREKGVSVL